MAVRCEGSASREDTSACAERFMLGEYEEQPDIMVMQALQYLHGFDMAYWSPDHRLIGRGMVARPASSAAWAASAPPAA